MRTVIIVSMVLSTIVRDAFVLLRQSSMDATATGPTFFEFLSNGGLYRFIPDPELLHLWGV